MQRLEVSGAVRLIYRSLSVKGLNQFALVVPRRVSDRERTVLGPYEYSSEKQVQRKNTADMFFKHYNTTCKWKTTIPKVDICMKKAASRHIDVPFPELFSFVRWIVLRMAD